MYNATPFKLRGCIYVGQWKDGLRHGRGLTRWAESAPSWEKNYLPSSVIVEEVYAPDTVRGAKTIGLPFCYEGRFKNNLRHDTAAKVVLKDGTTRVGPWKDDIPLRDWWKDHEKRRSRVPTNAASAESRSEREHPRSRIENSRERCLSMLSSEQRDVPPDQRLVSLRSKQPYRDVRTSAFSERDQPMASSRGRTDKSRERELISLLVEQRNPPSPSQLASTAFSKSNQRIRDTRTPAFSEYAAYEQPRASPFSRTEKSQELSLVSLATEQRDQPPDQPMLTAFLNYERPMPAARTSQQHHAKPSAHRRHQVDPSLQDEDATERVTRHPSNRRYSFELSSEEDVSMNKPNARPHRTFEPQQEDPVTERVTRHPSRHCYSFELSSEEEVRMNKPTSRSHRPFEQPQQEDPVPVSPRSTTTTTSEENDRFYDIAEWIGDIIGYNPDEDEMNAYARELNNLGLHSVTMIQNECTPDEVESFDWMKPFHKKRFYNYIHGIRTGN
jgi:hypothetical protein